jgi:hypothetical protein
MHAWMNEEPWSLTPPPPPPPTQAMRFGSTRRQLEEAIGIAFAMTPVPKEAVHVSAIKMLGMVSCEMIVFRCILIIIILHGQRLSFAWQIHFWGEANSIALCLSPSPINPVGI